MLLNVYDLIPVSILLVAIMSNLPHPKFDVYITQSSICIFCIPIFIPQKALEQIHNMALDTILTFISRITLFSNINEVNISTSVESVITHKGTQCY